VSSFVRRARELAELSAFVGHHHQVMTLVGPGGAGKTRQAVHWLSNVIDPRTCGGVRLD
jgi:ABC-type branched-subunit amino acid transport system ATPase component